MVDNLHGEDWFEIMTNMSDADAAQRMLTLPEEFLLLAHQPSGGLHDLRQVEFGCAAAELAELALLRRLIVTTKKFRIFGFEAFLSGGDIRLVDTRPTGLAWADALLADLASHDRRKRRPDSIPAWRWLSRRHEAAFALHCSALTSRRLLSGGSSYEEARSPDPAARHALVCELRDTYSGQTPFDERRRLLGDLVDGANLTRELELTLSPQLRMDWARSRGAMGLLPEEIRDTASTLGSMMPRSRRSSGGGGDDGGDGGGE